MSNVSLKIDGSAGQKVLGVQWNVLEDEFHFDVKSQNMIEDLQVE